MERLIEDLNPLKLSGDRRRQISAVEILELIDSPASRSVLEKLAAGFADARLTREAQRSLDRLKH